MSKSMGKGVADVVRRIAFQRSVAARPCAHVGGVAPVPSGSLTCPSCEARGEPWVKLRMCLTCGSVGCCDTSRLRHARAHFEATGHPVMRSIEPGEAWAWCYPDQAYLGSADAPLR